MLTCLWRCWGARAWTLLLADPRLDALTRWVGMGRAITAL